MDKRVKLGDYVDLLAGYPFKSAGYVGGQAGVRLLRGDNISQRKLRWEDARCWPPDESPRLEAYQLEVGDVVLAMDRPWIDAGLKYAMLRESDVPSLLVQRVTRMRACAELDQCYLGYLIGGRDFTNHVLSVQTGTAVPHISTQQIKDFEFSLPPLPAQRAVAAVLGALDDKIAVNGLINSIYERLLSLRFEELEIDVDPDPQNQVSTCELVEFNSRLPSPSAENAVYLDMSALPTSTARVQDWLRRPPKSGNRFMNGDTVMARITPCLENGKTAFVDFMADGEIGVGSTEFIVMRARESVPVHFPYFLARSPRFRSIAIRNMVGSSGRQRVSANQLADVPLARPNREALVNFGEQASNAFAHMKSLGEESANLAELRDTLLPRLMSDELRVKDVERAAEDVL